MLIHPPLFVSWLRPHYPLTCPAEFYNLYPIDNMDDARFTHQAQLSKHPVVNTIRKHFNYDESSKIPMIVSGPGIPENHQCLTLSSLADIYPTILNVAFPDINEITETDEKPGIDLQTLASHPEFDRPIFSEYHDGGSPTRMFMLRNARWKYNVYPGYDYELFDMESDPGESTNLANNPDYTDVLKDCEQQMQSLLDPQEQNRRAFSDQSEMIKKLGGVNSIVNSDEFDFTPVEK